MKPILFNTAMVQAILEGRKTSTRRIIKDVEPFGKALATPKGIFSKEGLARQGVYRIGDILYVRETWMIQSMKNFEKNIKFLYKAEPNEKLNEVHVSAKRYEEMLKFECKNGWQPSLFMPKEAGRIFLKVASVKVQRLSDMEDEDYFKEGIRVYTKDGKVNKFAVNEEQYKWQDMPRNIQKPFFDLWNSTLKKEQLKEYGWESNPYVWVIEFERIEKSEVE